MKTNQRESGGKMHTSVLVIDDEPELAEYTAKYFNMSGIETQYALTAQDARNFLKNNTCSLILLDINIPPDIDIYKAKPTSLKLRSQCIS